MSNYSKCFNHLILLCHSLWKIVLQLYFCQLLWQNQSIIRQVLLPRITARERKCAYYMWYVCIISLWIVHWWTSDKSPWYMHFMYRFMNHSSNWRPALTQITYFIDILKLRHKRRDISVVGRTMTFPKHPVLISRTWSCDNKSPVMF